MYKKGSTNFCRAFFVLFFQSKEYYKVMVLDFLPNKYKDSLAKLDMDKLSEIRLRKDFATCCKYSFEKYYLSKTGLSLLKDNAIICTQQDIDDIINVVTEFSIYAFNDYIKQGFLTSRNGIRIGIAGECVYNDNKIVTIKNISSLNVRIPREIDNCSKKIFEYVQNNNVIYNTLIISPPAYGKTTILKDLAKKINQKNKYSILILDERGELQNVKGENIDIISFSDKLYGLEYGVRTLSPDVVITDEISNKSDWECVLKAVNCGVKIIATCHGTSLNDVRQKNGFFDEVFERYVVLSSKTQKPGVLEFVFDKNGRKI